MERPRTDSTAAQPEQPPRSLYKVQYVKAIKLFNNKKFDECIEAARYTLNDPTLPRYYHIKSLLLIANAEEDWYPAERCRREAEDVKRARLSVLRTLRKDLNAVAASLQKEAPSVVDERFLLPGFDPENMDMEWESGEEEREDNEDKTVGASATGAEDVAASWESVEERKAGPAGDEVMGASKASAAHGGGSSVAESVFSVRASTTMPRRTPRTRHFRAWKSRTGKKRLPVW
ncbi:hypothetical protein LTR97_004003 [Elasticomyces elasticus]|uniref:Uncharacterized protein n=1 Tax=Elasticomyces elasticus TaxID=574655 RepID=A0AAN7VTQ3_9PEZI|nr:hypothetical protein LTR97_004003 [Elasticomyces elasticus]